MTETYTNLMILKASQNLCKTEIAGLCSIFKDNHAKGIGTR